MPALRSPLIEPVWDQLSALLPGRPVVAPTPPLGCHRPRIPDRVVFDHIIAAVVHRSGSERVASPGCSDRTIRRRLQKWATAGLTETLHPLAPQQSGRMIGLELDYLAVDGCITKAPGGGAPLLVVSAGANRNDAPVLVPTLAGVTTRGLVAEETTMQLDRGDDNAPVRALLDHFGLTGAIARNGVPAPIQAGQGGEWSGPMRG